MLASVQELSAPTISLAPTISSLPHFARVLLHTGKKASAALLTYLFVYVSENFERARAIAVPINLLCEKSSDTIKTLYTL